MRWMSPVPTLRVVPLEKICRHEEVDPLRVDRLVGRIDAEGIQGNPMICSEAPSGDLVVLDGATRTEALKKLGISDAVVQVVDPGRVTLETWHHVVRDCQPTEIIGAIAATDPLTLADNEFTPRIRTVDGESHSVLGAGISPNATLSALVDTYTGKWTVNRVADPSIESVEWRYPDWCAVLELPTLTVEEVMKAAVGEDLLPAGITRFLIPERALRLNMDLSLLGSDRTQEEKQQSLEDLLEQRANDGRIRRYEETVFILDD
jgi:L-serine kinase (ATP) / ParB family transcriptional regulator, heme-responsive regulator